ncbi:MAG: hypothetical protein K2R98_31640 [Gemmataceae bacterium]|nr:hypothetical protein [Gemmataceae bacterium]
MGTRSKAPLFLVAILAVIVALGFAFSGYLETGDKASPWERQPRSRSTAARETKVELSKAGGASGCCSSSGGCCCAAKGKKCGCGGGSAATEKNGPTMAVQATGLICAPLCQTPLAGIPGYLVGDQVPCQAPQKPTEERPTK